MVRRVVIHLRLWFDVEERYNTTVASTVYNIFPLWFDVEERYNTTFLAESVTRV